MNTATILLKLERLLDTLEGAAHFCEETAEQHFGHIASRRSGMAYAYNDAAKDLIHLIDDIKGEQQ
jgi:hypothetical protein